MESRNDILNELQELSPVVAAIEKVNVFRVPNGYFEHLSADIMAGIETENGINNQQSSISLFSEAPEGYFESFADHVLSKIRSLTTEDASAELRALSPMLYSVQNENVFEVPKGYFERLSDDVLDKVKPKHQKLIVMGKRTRTFFKYAVAAAFTGVMALGVFKFTGTSKGFAELPDYVKIGLNIKDVDQELAKISETDIVNYLEANGSDVKAMIVANSVDENELPTQEDYLLDENALDKYLNSINVKDLNN